MVISFKHTGDIRPASLVGPIVENTHEQQLQSGVTFESIDEKIKGE
ncbi:hypothetical protein [Rossellomorea sp. NRS-1567]